MLWAVAAQGHDVDHRKMVAEIALKVIGTTQIVRADVANDLAPPWRRLGGRDAIFEATGVDLDKHPGLEDLRSAFQAAGVTLDPQPTWAKTVDKILQILVEPNCCHFWGYPVASRWPAKARPSRVCRAFRSRSSAHGTRQRMHRANDPLDQRARLEEAAAGRYRRCRGSPGREGFREALMHPARRAVWSAVDRLVMLLTGADDSGRRLVPATTRRLFPPPSVTRSPASAVIQVKRRGPV